MFYSHSSQQSRVRAARILSVVAVSFLAACSAAGDGPTSTAVLPSSSGTGPPALVDMSTPAVALGGVGSTQTISAIIRDANGRVRDVEGVVIADVSLMPQIPRANTNLPAIMIGERIARTLSRPTRVWVR